MKRNTGILLLIVMVVIGAAGVWAMSLTNNNPNQNFTAANNSTSSNNGVTNNQTSATLNQTQRASQGTTSSNNNAKSGSNSSGNTQSGSSNGGLTGGNYVPDPNNPHGTTK